MRVISTTFYPWGVELRPLGHVGRTCLPLYPPSIITVLACMLPYEHVSRLMSIYRFVSSWLSRPRLDAVHVLRPRLTGCLSCPARSGSPSKESSGIRVAHSMRGRYIKRMLVARPFAASQHSEWLKLLNPTLRSQVNPNYFSDIYMHE